MQVQTILSQNTTDTNSHKTFANLKADFKDWDDVRRAPSGVLLMHLRNLLHFDLLLLLCSHICPDLMTYESQCNKNFSAWPL